MFLHRVGRADADAAVAVRVEVTQHVANVGQPRAFEAREEEDARHAVLAAHGAAHALDQAVRGLDVHGTRGRGRYADRIACWNVDPKVQNRDGDQKLQADLLLGHAVVLGGGVGCKRIVLGLAIPGRLHDDRNIARHATQRARLLEVVHGLLRVALFLVAVARVHDAPPRARVEHLVDNEPDTRAQHVFGGHGRDVNRQALCVLLRQQRQIDLVRQTEAVRNSPAKQDVACHVVAHGLHLLGRRGRADDAPVRKPNPETLAFRQLGHAHELHALALLLTAVVGLILENEQLVAFELGVDRQLQQSVRRGFG